MDRRNYTTALSAGLETGGGHAVVAAFAVGGPTKCSGLDIVQYDCENLSAELGAGFAFALQHNEIHVTPGGKEQKFSYFVFRKEK